MVNFLGHGKQPAVDPGPQNTQQVVLKAADLPARSPCSHPPDVINLLGLVQSFHASVECSFQAENGHPVMGVGHCLLDGLQENAAGFQMLDVDVTLLEEPPVDGHAVALGLGPGGDEVLDELVNEHDSPVFGVNGGCHRCEFVQMVSQDAGDIRDDVGNNQQRIFGCSPADVAIRQFNLEREFRVIGLLEWVILVQFREHVSRHRDGEGRACLQRVINVLLVLAQPSAEELAERVTHCEGDG